MWGNASDGDCDELRLMSTNETFINLRGHGGSLDFENTKVRPLFYSIREHRSTSMQLRALSARSIGVENTGMLQGRMRGHNG